ncbi:MAG: helix-turn-helix transcriptional regulator [Clostridia bacterium]|nr:helix-turn-helix transcriptional regulator [Clostridia bacterium]
MKSRNICKFPAPNIPRELTVSSFVLETDQETMAQKVLLLHHRMILVEQGEGVFILDGTPYPFSPGTLIFGFKKESFFLSKGEQVQYLYIEFGGTYGEALFRRFEIYPHTRKRDNLTGLIPFCKNCLQGAQQENVDIAAESVLLYVFSRLSGRKSSQNDILQRILELTEERFRDPEHSITSVAQEIGYNPKYLSHLFKEKMNIRYSEYLRSFRFKYAISLFELGISSVKNVALLSGFTDPLYFSNVFKKEMGLSPKEFIADLRKHE